MFIKRIATALALSVAIGGVAMAQAPSPTRIEQFKAWGAYSYKQGKNTVCYVLSVPTDKQPASVNHGDVFFIVSQRPGQNISYEPQAMVGYPLKEGSKVTVKVDTKSFIMFTKDNSAWVENAAQEPELVAAMKSGKTMSVAAVSSRGTNTSYTFSLQGISDSLKRIEKCK
ncbi:invasion associated locus B family protein [Allorhizobium sp. BGMRC 0089]|uniref:invasion associated locus B family protein n=1 Tax=Allorhizobium sonneratiae TaxID=2934936 RepID=UPI0020340C3A|nr:invasion associated locus B family protein [Allorhizobium sonneratiae]MCM2293370.1 invasion associated locus B family protein [Allorhizobium sonneratiae]